ncbi:TIGR03086 family metal-binding protein [Amycolatopsis thermoflava]|uniref:TIGR03086 family metal-binding protein n=1 Tax=Amycolatopsis thermoflava TaxID=84480 RepID=UPI0003F90D57|nr:TIGR03086 family metal-binding protein [Amycolatopsis thermoflava]
MDIRDLDRRVLAEVDKIVSGATDLGLRTPCAGWTLGDLLTHQVSENHAFAVALREGAAPDWTSGTLGDDPYRAYAESVDAFLAASADDTVLDREVTVREFGTFPAPVALTMHLVDSVAHGWDLARTLDAPYEPDPEAVHVALRFAERMRTRPRPDDDVFAPAVEIAPGTGELDRFLALTGRDPAWR